MAIELGADALGLVGPMPSGAGVIDDGAAAEIARITPPPVSTFLLTSEKSADGISRHAAGVCPTALQVVSHIDPQEYRRLDASLLRACVKRIQVIHVEGEEALDLIDAYSAHVDAFLLDSGRPLAVTPELGGTGRTHDWDISAAFVRQSPLPVFLAGGFDAP